MERLCSWPSWISARARSHSRLGLEGHKGHLIANALARPFLHLLIPTRRPRRESQLLLSGSARAVPSEPPSLARPIWRATGATGGGGHLYGPAARCKPKVMIWRSWVLRFCIRPLNGTFVFLAIMDIRALDLIRVSA